MIPVQSASYKQDSNPLQKPKVGTWNKTDDLTTLPRLHFRLVFNDVATELFCISTVFLRRSPAR